MAVSGSQALSHVKSPAGMCAIRMTVVVFDLSEPDLALWCSSGSDLITFDRTVTYCELTRYDVVSSVLD